MTKRERACFGPRQLKVPGSPEWVMQTLEVAKARWMRKQGIDAQWESVLKELVAQEVWLKVAPPFESLERLLQAEGIERST